MISSVVFPIGCCPKDVSKTDVLISIVIQWIECVLDPELEYHVLGNDEENGGELIYYN